MALDSQPARLLGPDRALIQFSTHGALFRIADAHRVAGPCAGDRLTGVAVEIRGGRVYIGA